MISQQYLFLKITDKSLSIKYPHCPKCCYFNIGCGNQCPSDCYTLCKFNHTCACSKGTYYSIVPTTKRYQTHTALQFLVRSLPPNESRERENEYLRPQSRSDACVSVVSLSISKNFIIFRNN